MSWTVLSGALNSAHSYVCTFFLKIIIYCIESHVMLTETFANSLLMQLSFFHLVFVSANFIIIMAKISLGPLRHNIKSRVSCLSRHARCAVLPTCATQHVMTFCCAKMYELDSMLCHVMMWWARWNLGLSPPCILAEEKVMKCSVMHVGQQDKSRQARHARLYCADGPSGIWAFQ